MAAVATGLRAPGSASAIRVGAVHSATTARPATSGAPAPLAPGPGRRADRGSATRRGSVAMGCREPAFARAASGFKAPRANSARQASAPPPARLRTPRQTSCQRSIRMARGATAWLQRGLRRSSCPLPPTTTVQGSSAGPMPTGVARSSCRTQAARYSTQVARPRYNRASSGCIQARRDR